MRLSWQTIAAHNIGMARVLIPLPSRDFDPSEVAVSWRVLTARGHTVQFATPDGSESAGDEMMLTGRGLDVWGFIPRLRRFSVVGRVLRTNADARADYANMLASPEFRRPLPWNQLEHSEFDGLLLPGGHRARGMREYLESSLLQRVVSDAFTRELPVAAICHGVLLAARSHDPTSGESVLRGRRTTALTWSLESAAWRVARVARFWDPGYYRTYPDGAGRPIGYMSVQAEVTRALADSADFLDVDPGGPDAAAKSSGRVRDTATDSRPAFVVRDGRYLSARWPGDVHTFAWDFADMLNECGARGE